jgi:hypothetical protein
MYEESMMCLCNATNSQKFETLFTKSCITTKAKKEKQ